MTSSDSPVQPPRVAAWLVELFASPQEADGILGDLAEEFSASVARDSDPEARRRYERQAWRTIRDLAVSPWIAVTGSARPFSGFMLAFGVGLAGLVMMLPIVMATNAAAGMVVRQYPIYYYIPASVFWNAVYLFAPMMTGFMMAIIARGLRFRPMSAALALVASTAIVLALDIPILRCVMWLSGRTLTLPPHVTLAWSAVRWLQGVWMFGGMMLVGAVIGRKVPFRGDALLRRHHAE